jgi:hypothetical protein
MMSDSTNVLTPGRTPGEAIVKDSLMQKVMDYQGKGRVVVTQVGKHVTVGQGKLWTFVCHTCVTLTSVSHTCFSRMQREST